MNIYLYILDTMADWEIGFLTAEIKSKRYFRDQNESVEIITVGSSEKSITTMGGMELYPQKTIDKVQFTSEDILVLPGSNTWHSEENSAVIKIAAERIEQGLKVAAICGATIALANAGALNHIKHTSNDLEYLKMVCQNYKGAELYQYSPAYTHYSVITATGLAPIEFTYEVLKLVGVFKEETLTAWYNLYIKKDASSFFELMNSLQ